MRLAVLAAGVLLAAPASAAELIAPGGGFVRVEEDPTDVAPAQAPAPDGPEAARNDAEAGGGVRQAPPSREDVLREVCRGELNAYLRELLAMIGVDGVDDPLALVAGLEATGAFGGQHQLVGVTWPLDPVQPLAWSSELRRRARDVAACVRRAG
jgi:hypothetical protein